MRHTSYGSYTMYLHAFACGGRSFYFGIIFVGSCGWSRPEGSWDEEGNVWVWQRHSQRSCECCKYALCVTLHVYIVAIYYVILGLNYHPAANWKDSWRESHPILWGEAKVESKLLQSYITPFCITHWYYAGTWCYLTYKLYCAHNDVLAVTNLPTW